MAWMSELTEIAEDKLKQDLIITTIRQMQV